MSFTVIIVTAILLSINVKLINTWQFNVERSLSISSCRLIFITLLHRIDNKSIRYYNRESYAWRKSHKSLDRSSRININSEWIESRQRQENDDDVLDSTICGYSSSIFFKNTIYRFFFIHHYLDFIQRILIHHPLIFCLSS